MSKTFAQAPKPRTLTAEAIAAFERGGAGQDTQISKPTNVGKMDCEPIEKEPMRRLSIDLPETLHRRFKTACSKTDRKMLIEVTEMIRRRIAELEGEQV